MYEGTAKANRMVAMATTIMSSIRLKPPRGRDERVAVRNCMVPLCRVLAQFDPGQTAARGIRRQVQSQRAAEDVVAVDAGAALDLVGFEHEEARAGGVAGDERAAGRVRLHGDGMRVRVLRIAVDRRVGGLARGQEHLVEGCSR